MVKAQKTVENSSSTQVGKKEKMSTENRIPEDPKDNLARMESICAGYRRKLAENRRSHAHIRETLELKLDDLDDEEAKGEEADQTKMEGLKMLVRKYQYDLKYFGRQIKELKGRIAWAEGRQIPFLQEEVDRLNDTLTYQPFASALGATEE